MTNYKSVFLLLSGLTTLSFTLTTHGQSAADIVVTAPVMERALYETPAAMSVVQQEAIQNGQQRLKLDETLSQVPGIFLQNQENYAQGERVAIRGFGARAPFGVRGITVIVDGIPYTLPDGQAQLDAIDLDSAERIEVIRGPASVLYGNAAGGVISVTTSDGRRKPDETSVRITGGSDNFGKLSVKNNQQNGPWSHSVSASALNYEGYRDNAKVEKYLLNTKLRRELGNDRSLTTIVNLLQNPRSEDPGALTAEQVEADRSQAGRFTEDYDTGQTVDQQVLGLQYQDLSAGPGELRAKTFYLRRNFEQQLPYPGDSRIDYDRDYFGARVDYRQSLELSGVPFRYVTGLEAREQRDDRIRREMSFGGDLQGLTADELQTATALSAFAQGDLSLTDQWLLSVGGRFDRIRLRVDDDFSTDGDQNGSRTFREWSGSAGLSYRYLPNHQAYANISTAFETPTFSEFANPSGVGGLNPETEPQKSLNHELGLRGELNTGISYDLTLFWVDVRDELIPYELPGPDDRTFYRNAGDTTRKGIEAAAGWLFSPSWRAETALTLASYEFDTYRSGSDRYDGNRLPGLPEQVWSNRLTWQGLGGIFAALEVRYIGDIVADDANEVKVDGYWLVNLRGGNTLYAGRNILLKGFAGIRNLGDKDHFANIRINASNNRYFEPASGRTWYAGLEFVF
ncbi:TonB-dependent receptor [Streptosporangium jomthongense]|uniref:TonB-dependent receptor family protein n=1 Tax=Marinobacter aromaticivorans TaxID=1494078 RepID=A0ABW2J0H4_9GAMM|nr:TonB-dependent receptor [Marinobacter aromaticivorans]GGE80391.1 TonB-dependent receptor [Streptosporangium jomthongense]